jgi:hypothetical protein
MFSRLAATSAILASATSHALAAPPRELDKADYTDRLHAMWLAECVANWTGIKTEGRRQAAPFHTDADWGANPYPDSPWINLSYVLFDDPWKADDDTDIEYVYLHLLTQFNATHLTPDQIRDGWVLHINHDIWVSDAAARALMTIGARPPATAFAQAMGPPGYADHSLKIDAQLTTEFFGALAPGMPDIALELADLPIRTTACGHAAHAAQFYVILYSLATQVDRTLSPADQVVWLVRQARKFIPDTSKAADIADFVLADYLSNADKDDWESTRDKVYQRYQLNAAVNGFTMRGWNESSVNFACGLIALLYGQLDIPKTIRIGALSGWDSDNGTATMGGLMGLTHGMPDLLAAFPEWQASPPSDRFWIGRTRDNLPDYLPADPAADDTLTLMAQRCIPIIDRVVAESGGRVSDSTWLLAPGGAGDGLTHAAALNFSPTQRDTARSANIQVPLAGGAVTPESSISGFPESGYGSWYLPLICSGAIYDFRGTEIDSGWKAAYSTERSTPTPAIHSLTVTYSQPVEVHTIRFVEGLHHHAPTDAHPGGWFESAIVEAFVNGAWIAPTATPSEPLNPDIPFQTIDFILAQPITATAIRISGPAGGGGGDPDHTFITCAALDALSSPIAPLRKTFDVNGDGSQDVEDLYRWCAGSVDLNNDGAADGADRDDLRRAVRWNEREGMATR